MSLTHAITITIPVHPCRRSTETTPSFIIIIFNILIALDRRAEVLLPFAAQHPPTAFAFAAPSSRPIGTNPSRPRPNVIHAHPATTTTTTTTDIMTANEEKKEAPSPTTGRAALLARPNVLALQPYRCARDDYDSGVLLDANENALGPASLPTNSLDPYDNGMELERYPCPYQRDVKQLLCDYRNGQAGANGSGGGGGEGAPGIAPANVFCGVGSDEAIDLLIRIFCAPGHGAGGGEAIMITPPTYGMYRVCANVNDVGIQSVPLTEDFDLRVPEVRFFVFGKRRRWFACFLGAAFHPGGGVFPSRETELESCNVCCVFCCLFVAGVPYCSRVRRFASLAPYYFQSYFASDRVEWLIVVFFVRRCARGQGLSFRCMRCIVWGLVNPAAWRYISWIFCKCLPQPTSSSTRDIATCDMDPTANER